MALSVIGDNKTGTAVKTVVCLNTLPQATTAQLTSKADPINLTNSSGKRAGSVVLNSTTNILMVATGALDVSTWIHSGATAPVITPV